MSDYTNTLIGSGYNTNTSINTELSAVETAVNSKLDKSGSTMTGELDMNSKKILNLPDATTLQEPVTYGQMINGASFAAADAKYFDTVALATADTTLAVGDVVIIEERASGVFNVISGTGTANTYNIIAHDTLSLSLELRGAARVSLKSCGLVDGGVVSSFSALQAAVDAFDSFVVDGNFLIDGDVTLTSDKEFFGIIGNQFLGTGSERFDVSNDASTLFNGVKFNNMGNVFYISGNVDSLEMVDCEFSGGDQVFFRSADTNSINSFRAINNYIHDCEKGIFIQQETLSNVHIEANRFENLSTAETQNAAIRVGDDVADATPDRKRFFISNNIINGVHTTTNSSRSWGISAFGDRVIITGNIVEDITTNDAEGGEGIYTKCRYGTVAHNSLLNAGDTTQGAITIKGRTRSDAVTATLGWSMSVINNKILSTNAKISAGIYSSTDDCIISENTIEGVKLNAIVLGGGDYDNVSVTNNTMLNIAYNTAINVVNDGSNINISDNLLDGLTDPDASATSYFLQVQSGSTATDGITIRDNRINITSTSTTGQVGAFRFNQNSATYSNVRILGNKVNIPTSLTPTTYGIRVQGTTNAIDGLTIENNDFSNVDTPLDLNTTTPPLRLRISRNKFPTYQTTSSSTLNTISFPISDETASIVESRVVGKSTDSTERAIYGKVALYYRDAGGSATLEGAIQDVFTDVETTASMDSTFSVSGNSVRAVVAGVAATDIDWDIDLTVKTI